MAIDVQVLGGLTIYVVEYWDHPSALVSYLHPLLAVGAVAAAHVTLARARRAETSTLGHRRAGVGLLAALVLAAGAIAAISAGLRTDI